MNDLQLITFRDLLNDTRFCKKNTQIILNHRQNESESWSKICGNCLDDHILRFMDCNLLAVKYEIGEPLMVAVEGKPHEWGV